MEKVDNLTCMIKIDKTRNLRWKSVTKKKLKGVFEKWRVDSKTVESLLAWTSWGRRGRKFWVNVRILKNNEFRGLFVSREDWKKDWSEWFGSRKSFGNLWWFWCVKSHKVNNFERLLHPIIHHVDPKLLGVFLRRYLK